MYKAEDINKDAVKLKALLLDNLCCLDIGMTVRLPSLLRMSSHVASLTMKTCSGIKQEIPCVVHNIAYIYITMVHRPTQLLRNTL